MDMSKVKLIFSEKYNQFYKPMRIDEDVGIVYMQVTKNRHEKGMKKEEIIHIEQNQQYKYIIMHDEKVTAEKHFLDVMSSNRNTYVKLNELNSFKKNMLPDSDAAMQRLKELSESKIDNKADNYNDLKKIHNTALTLYLKINHREIIADNRDTYIDQEVPTEIRKLALSKRLFIERSDDYCGKGKYKHPCNKKERLQIQSLYPCGFIIRDRGGVVIAGGCFQLSVEDVVKFINNYVPTKSEKHYNNFYKVPMSLRKKKQLKMCYKILQSHGLHYKNEHNYFFWVLDKNKNVIAGGKNGFGFKWLLKYCRRLQNQPKKKNLCVADNVL